MYRTSGQTQLVLLGTHSLHCISLTIILIFNIFSGNETDATIAVGDGALVPMNMNSIVPTHGGINLNPSGTVGGQLMVRKAPSMPKPKWHPPWKLFRVISGHLGWVRCVAVEPGNQWFATGSADRVIKVYNL